MTNSAAWHAVAAGAATTPSRAGYDRLARLSGRVGTCLFWTVVCAALASLLYEPPKHRASGSTGLDPLVSLEHLP
jgi:hypothetical protein